MQELARKITDDINEAIVADSLLLPTMPEMALQVREVANKNDASISDLARVISQDAALTARVIKVANSPLFRAAQEIKNLNMAMSRLGLQYTSNLVIGLAMEQMFQATSDFVDQRLREIWARSTEIAGLCHVLCEHLTPLKADQASLAGLVHQIGVLPIMAFAEENPALLEDEAIFDIIVSELHPELGCRILKAWDFPVELQQIPFEYLDFSRTPAQADYGDLVTVAVLHSYTGANQPPPNLNFGEVSAFSRLGLDPEIEFTEAADISDEMVEAIKLLQ